MLKRLLYYLIFFGIMILLFEVSSYYIAKKIFNPRGLVYDPPELSQQDYKDYRKRFHKQLGWIVAKNQEAEIDEVGSRMIPSFPNPKESPACISLYGDSYTFSNRTKPEDAWSNQLSKLLDCRVSNFGVSGYGTGQALMRYKLNLEDTARVVFLNHFVDDIPRNVSQYWGIRFTVKRQAFVFKPRYIINEANELEKIPVPEYSLEEVRELQKNPEAYLKHDYFLPGGHYGSMRLRFPYTWVVLKTIFSHSKFKSMFDKVPTHMPFYEESHPAQALQLTERIILEFEAEAKKRNQHPIVTIIPFSTDFDYFREQGKWSYQNLIDKMQSNQIEFINLGEEIEKRIQGKDQHYLYAGEGHFNAVGDKMIAEIIGEYLKDNIKW